MYPHTIKIPGGDAALQDFPLSPREPVVLSVGQFRPEKDHPLQIRAFARFLKQQRKPAGVRLVLLGSCRGAEDRARVEGLRRLVAEEGIEVCCYGHAFCVMDLKRVCAAAGVAN